MIAAPNRAPEVLHSELIRQLESIGSRVSFSAGEAVLQEGEAGKGIYFLQSGLLSLSVSPQDGSAIALRSLQPGAFIGLSATLSCDHCCYTVTAVESSELTFVPTDAAQELLRTRPDLCLQVIQLLGQEMNSLCAERAAVNVRSQRIQIGK